MSVETEPRIEAKEKSAEHSPFKTSLVGRLGEIAKNPEAKEGIVAAGRLLVNVGISAVDLVPVVGEVVGWTADALKFVKPLDLTPDVSKSVAIGTEALEFAGMGAVPTHAIETVLQAHADLKEGRFENAKNAIAYLITGKENYSNELKENKGRLDEAAKQFA